MLYNPNSVLTPFRTNQDLDIPQVRELMVNLEERYLEILTGTKEVKPYLLDYPVDSRIFELGILFFSHSGNGFVHLPNISTASILNGKIFYTQYEPIKDSLKTIFSESYEEAYKIVYGHEKVLKEEASLDFVPEES